MKAFTKRLVSIFVLVPGLFQPLPAPGSGRATLAQTESGRGINQANYSEGIQSVLVNATAVSAGEFHTCALTINGGVKCWGYNTYGQLGDGTITDRWSPVDVVGLTSGVMAISAGWRHTCALMISGGVKCWGSNYDGQLGDGTNVQHTTAMDVVGLASGVSAVSAGGFHTCALTGSGGVKCWGANFYGQLSDGTYTNHSTPVDVVGLADGISALSAGKYHTCALTGSGGVKCWGANYYGQLGDGTDIDRNMPVEVFGLAKEVSALSAGGEHTCALMIRGGLKCWGSNWNGELGDGTKTHRYTPVDVVGLAGRVSALRAGGHHTCALTFSRRLMCWGWNHLYGQLGDGTLIDRATPVDVLGLTSEVSTLSSGGQHTCALMVNGTMKCWGDNQYGQLGNGTTNYNRNMPMDVVGLTSGASAIRGGGHHTCALMADGAVKCWGHNNYGQLGIGTNDERMTPVDVLGLTSEVSTISAGYSHTCALTVSGGVKCWGYNFYGQLGDGTNIDRWSPVDVAGLASGVKAISAGGYFTCALLDNGGVKCWGYNLYGQLGDGTNTDRWSPVDVAGLASGVSAINTGYAYTCAAFSSGGVKCWGDNQYGQLGDGTNIARYIPVDVVGLENGVNAIIAGGFHTCALMAGGGVKCWGCNWNGELGDGTNTHRKTPVDVVGLASDVSALSAGSHHSCALTVGGGMECWGWNKYGQLGEGTNTDRLTPVNVVGLASGVSAISAGWEHTCALTGSGGVKCWGSDDSGQLGDGAMVDVVSNGEKKIYFPMVTG